MSEMPIKSVAARVALVDPSTSPERLAEIARRHPELRAAVAVHPNVYPDLLAWLEHQDDPLVQLLVVQRRALDGTPPPATPSADVAADEEPDASAEDEADDLPGDIAEPEAADEPVARPIRLSRRGKVIVAGTAAAILALLVWFLLVPALRRGGAGHQAAWSAAVATGAGSIVGNGAPLPDVVGVDGVAVMDWIEQDATGAQTARMVGIDLTTDKQLWSQTAPGLMYTTFLDGSAVVVWVGNTVEIIDPRTGKASAEATMADNDYVMAADGGLVITGGYQDTAMCARTLANLSACAWQGTSTKAAPPIMFGGGTWVNSWGGVVAASSGAPAPFGADVVSDAQQSITYMGPAKDKVLRRQTDFAAGGTSTYQLWNTSANGGVGDAFTAQDVAFDAAGADYYATLADARSTTVSAYAWQTGARAWQTTLPFAVPAPSPAGAGSIVGKFLVCWAAGSFNSEAAAIDLVTGKTVWSAAGYVPVGIGKSVVFAQNASRLVAFDAASAGFRQLWSVDMPEWDASVQVVDNTAIAVSSDNQRLWVLRA